MYVINMEFFKSNLWAVTTVTPRTMGLRWWKMDLYVTFAFRNCLNLLSIRQSVEKLAQAKWCNASDQCQKETRKICCCDLRAQHPPKDAELGYFTLLFCRGWQRNVQNLKTQVEWPLFCSVNLLFGDVFVVVVDCLSSLTELVQRNTPSVYTGSQLKALTILQEACFRWQVQWMPYVRVKL